MRIAIENVGNAVKPIDLKRVVVAINKQLADFQKFWGVQATCQLGASSTANAVIYLQKNVDVDGVLGYHDLTAAGKPFGVVFTSLSEKLGEPWSATLSHEVLEMVADPEANRYAVGSHPSEDRVVFYWYEVCDPVQDETYTVDGVAVSNFVLPLYFTPVDEANNLTRNDFMRATGRKGGALSSLWLAPGGYAGFFDPESGEHEVVFADQRSKARHAARQGLGSARRASKYRTLTEPPSEQTAPVEVAEEVVEAPKAAKAAKAKAKKK